MQYFEIFMLIAFVGLFFMIYNSKKSLSMLTNPTAAESLQNKNLFTAMIGGAVVLAVVLISASTKRADILFTLIGVVSLIWYATGKTWQYTPV